MDNLNQKIGDYCRIARVTDKITQKQMAEYCGVTQQAISQFELGQNNSMKILFYYMSICNHYRDLMELMLTVREEVLNNGKAD